MYTCVHKMFLILEIVQDEFKESMAPLQIGFSKKNGSNPIRS